MNEEIIRRRHLPHWDVPHAPYFVTTCLDGSIPASGLLNIAHYREELNGRPRPQSMTDMDWKIEKWKKAFARMERWLDKAPANRCLETPELAQIIVNAMLYFAGERYDLFAYVVMPSHIHWLFQP